MVPQGGSDLYGASTKICVVRVVGTKTNRPSEFVCANKPGWSSTEMVAPWMGFLEVASITVPDAAGETYVVISMQPLSEIRNGRATMWRHLPMCGLRVKLRGRPEAPDWSRGCTLSSRTRGDTTDVHGPLQRSLDAPLSINVRCDRLFCTAMRLGKTLRQLRRAFFNGYPGLLLATPKVR